MRTADFDYELPEELIAQAPTPVREASRLLVVHRRQRLFEHRRFVNLLDYLAPGDLLILNNSRVIPARLRAVNAETGGRFEMLLLRETLRNQWWAMFRPGKRARVGTNVIVLDREGNPTGIKARVLATGQEGHRHIRFEFEDDITGALERLGEIPLPPYIRREERPEDRERYQTVYARHSGSVAAPTAGLHFSAPFLEHLRTSGVRTACVTLHVGLGTFAPVKTESVAEHEMHEERYEVTEETAQLVRETKRAGHRVVAVGTTSLRVLESAAAKTGGNLQALVDSTRLFVYPPANFQIVDGLLTNFHLPRSTLLMLVSAFAHPGGTGGIDLIKQAYAEAIREKYRFFSYGDAMVLL